MRKLRVLVLLAVLLSQVPLRAATLQVFESQATFLAATGASDATGPLPDLGNVATAGNPAGSATIGSITFSLAPGGESLAIGASGTGAAPDWYPQTPGHDIALGFENLRVVTAAPVFALGFEIVEPDATMPAWGGTPVDSSFRIRLFRSGVPVGEFIAGNLPKDVVTFIGVWSDTAFDRVEIVDLTGNDDDEYFGRFYTGTIAAPAEITAIAGTGAAVPGGTGVFTGFPQSPAVGARATAFLGLATSGQQGVYGCGSTPIDPCFPLANLTTLVPGGSGFFTGFGGLSVAEEILGSTPSPVRAAFIGSGVNQQGVYGCDSAAPIEPCRRIADRTTLIPAGTGTFAAFTSLAVAQGALGPNPSPSLVAFIGSGAGQQGIYGCGPIEPCLRIADRTTAIPGGTGTFDAFSSLALMANVFAPSPSSSRLAFIGSGVNQQGVYACDSATPVEPCSPIADLTTEIPGGSGSFTGFGGVDLAQDVLGSVPPQSAPLRVVFIGSGVNQQGVYGCDTALPVEPCRAIADLTTSIPEGTGTFTGFAAISASLEHTAFLGLGADGQAGIYVASTLKKVVAVGDRLTGKVVAGLRFGRDGLAGNRLGFTATFVDGSEGVFVTEVDASLFSFTGFLSPVNNLPVVNQVKAGQAVPLKFSLDGNQGLDIFAAGYPKSVPISCDFAAPVDELEETETAGGSSLTYDAATDRYKYVWKTDKRWTRTCRQFVLGLKDGTFRRANFQFR
jgi:hypothetical protein